MTKQINGPATLVYFDYHADDRAPPANQQLRDLLHKYRQDIQNEREFWSFVEWEVSSGDGDWLKIGMELGLIGDAISIGCCRDNGPAIKSQHYDDHTTQRHHIYDVGHIWDGVPRCWLADTVRIATLSPIWQLMGWCQADHKFGFLAKPDELSPIVLDFDLDCFSTPGPEGHIPWPIDYFAKLFGRPLNAELYQSVRTPADFLQQLSARAKFITIARESAYCGGYAASDLIMSCLDGLLFNNKLRLNGL
jgi:hypothetical protein